MPLRFSGPAMYKLFIAFRYLRRNWLNLVGTLAVALAVMAPICVLSVMKGFDQEFRSRFRATLSDLSIERRTDDPFGGYEGMMARIAKIPHVVACAAEYDGLGLLRMRLHAQSGWRSMYVQFHGVDLAVENRATDFPEFWRMWRGRQAGLELAELAAQGSGLGGESKQKVSELLSIHAPRGFFPSRFRRPRCRQVMGGTQPGRPRGRVARGRCRRTAMGSGAGHEIFPVPGFPR